MHLGIDRDGSGSAAGGQPAVKTLLFSHPAGLSHMDDRPWNGTYVGDFHAIVAGSSVIALERDIMKRDLGIVNVHSNGLASPLECARAAQKRAGPCLAMHTRSLQPTVAIGAGLVPVSTGFQRGRPNARIPSGVAYCRDLAAGDVRGVSRNMFA